MSVTESQLVVKRSTIPAAGKGLYTRKFIAKGTRIVEYTGKITTWKDVNHDDGSNVYIYYLKRYHVIDARHHTKVLARYANDANGLVKIKGIRNNSIYVTDGLRVFIHAAKDIPAGSEILVDYGREYWQVIRHNSRLDKIASKKVLK
ncbi:MAG: SET domain-containing protein [Chitinophagaceae bacterium]